MDPFNDPRVLDAEARHTKRRRRSGRIYDILDGVFYFALVAVVLLAFRAFFGLVGPHIGGG